MICCKSSSIGGNLKVNYSTKIRNVTKRLLSTQQEELSRSYVLSGKQRRALRKLEDGSDEGVTDTLEVTLDKMKQESLLQDMEETAHNPLPWHSLLVYPSRALWRSSPKPPPNYLLDTQFKIIQASERTPKQLRRTYDRIVSNHIALSEKRERERRSMVNGPRHAASSLEAKKQSGIDRSKNPVYYKPEHSVCSLKYRLVPNYSITKRILAETQSLLGKEFFQPKRILDVGIGAGSAAAGALDYFHEKKVTNVEWIHGVDPSQSMRDASKILLSQVLQGQKFSQSDGRQTRLTFGDNVLSSSEHGVERSGGSFDLALCAYTLHEIPSVAAQLSMAAIIWEKLSPNGVAIFIEPGTPDGFNSLRSARSMLLDCCPPDEEEKFDGEEECHVIAPCTHNGTCPMVRHQKHFFKKQKSVDEEENGNSDDIDEDEDEEVEIREKSYASETDVFDSAFCSFVHAMPGSTHRKHGEKFAYLVVQKRISDTSGLENDSDLKNPFKNTNIANLLKESLDAGKDKKRPDQKRIESLIDTAKSIEDKFLDSDSDKLGLELVRGNNRKSWGRIVRAPIKKKGHVILDYCTSAKDEEGVDTGKIVRSKISRSQGRTAPGMYLSSRKSRWGGFWPDITN